MALPNAQNAAAYFVAQKARYNGTKKPNLFN